MVDLGNYQQALGAVLNMSGFEQTTGAPQKDAASGEAPAPIGGASTPA